MARKLIAQFADGTTITRRTHRNYAAAWRASKTYPNGSESNLHGFARDYGAALKATSWCAKRGWSVETTVLVREA